MQPGNYLYNRGLKMIKTLYTCCINTTLTSWIKPRLFLIIIDFQQTCSFGVFFFFLLSVLNNNRTV